MINQKELNEILEIVQDEYRETIKKHLQENEQKLVNTMIDDFIIDLKYEILIKGLYI